MERGKKEQIDKVLSSEHYLTSVKYFNVFFKPQAPM